MMHPQCREVRELLLAAAFETGHGHLPSCFSVVEILHALYRTMRHDPATPQSPERDIFILSKGHASMALYATLGRLGYFRAEDLFTYGLFNSRLGCHPDRLKVPGVEASTGSLGHGIGMAVGAALGLKIQDSQRRVFTLIGDGEANEGSVWEALLVAVDRGLANLTVIYDNNRSHARGLQIRNPENHLEGFGCDVSVVDGHDIAALENAMARSSDRVRAIVAQTLKGYGCPSMTENHYAWHRRSPKDNSELSALLTELKGN